MFVIRTDYGVGIWVAYFYLSLLTVRITYEIDNLTSNIIVLNNILNSYEVL